MANRLSRRNTEIVRFLKTVLKNERAGLKVRMQAATRLDDLYRRMEEVAEKAEVRKLREPVAVTDVPPVEDTPELSAEEAARQFLERLGKQDKGDDAR